MKINIRTRHLSLSPEILAAWRRRVTVAFARISPWILRTKRRSPDGTRRSS